MKTADKISRTAFAVALVSGLLGSNVVCAQTPGQAPEMAQAPAATISAAPPTAGAVVVAPMAQPAAAPAPSSAEVSASVKEALDSINVPKAGAKTTAPPMAPTVAMPVMMGKPMREEESDKLDMPKPDVKIPDSVKTVVKDLSSATNEVTLDSLNAAREAVVKLDVLIDIEKRLNDLTKLRRDREENMGGISGDQIPTAALGAPGGIAPPHLTEAPQMPVVPVTPPVPVSTDLEVVRVVGASGNFVAHIKEPSGDTKLIRTGHKLPDGATVQSISRNGVSVLMPNKKTKVFSVKDVTTVFGPRQDR